MRSEITVRIKVMRPPAGVQTMVQRGRDELLEPIQSTDEFIVFDVPITVDRAAADPNFLGKYAQGPKNARFIYVNSGRYAGAQHPEWNRRAKISLSPVTNELLDQAAADPKAALEVCYQGTGRDGGPSCATIKDAVWSIIAK